MKNLMVCIAVFAALLVTIPMLALGGGPPRQPKPEQVSSINQRQVFKVLNVQKGKIEQIGALDYICGVVAAEEPASFHAEALKAQAVAAYTYAVNRREANLAHPGAVSSFKGADVSTDPNHCKAYLSKTDAQKKWGDSFSADWGKIQNAVTSVTNKVMVYDGKPILSVFCAMSAGATENSRDVWGVALPYLVSVPSAGDPLAPGFSATQTLTEAQVKQKISAKYPDAKFSKDPSGWITDIERSGAGGVISASVCGKKLLGETIRILLGLRSANFQLSVKDGVFKFSVKGYGHCVGMSQYGSEYMARQGKKWDEILKWYYRGVRIVDYEWKNV